MADVLVVEDEESLLQTLRYNLSRAGHAVRLCTDGSVGLEMALENPPDLLVLDLMLPGVDGLALLTFLRRVHPEVPIIIVSANTSHRVAHDCVKVGAFGYVPKPRRAGAAGSAPGDG